jgi:NhaP-type Na+/H+ or K+/H+ antiporter
MVRRILNMTRWHDRLVGAWFGVVGGTTLYVVWSLALGWGITSVIPPAELLSMAALWVAGGAVLGLPLLVTAAVLHRRLQRRSALGAG